jgi:hypothetical protein
MSATEPPRTYRLAPLDRTGWLLGLQPSQCLTLAAGALIAGFALQAGLPLPIAIVALGAAAVGTFATWGGRTAHEWAPVVGRFAVLRLTGRARWRAELPLLTGTASDERREPPTPPFLAGLGIVDVPGVAWSPATLTAGIGVVHDRRNHTMSASLPVSGRSFALLERGDQEWVIQQWGDVLAAFCTERGAVSRIRCTEFAAPCGLDDHERYAEARSDHAHGAARDAYRELLAEAGPQAVGHQVLITVTVDRRRIRSARKGHPGGEAAVTEAVVDELRLLSNRLEAAGLTVGAPLSSVQTAETLRERLDPASAACIRLRRASLAAMAGVVSRYDAMPLATEVTWSAVHCDGAWHRTYWVAEWPRSDVGPGWIEPLLLQAGGIRTFALHYHPVPPSRSRRQIDRDSTRLATDEEQRSRTGFRIGAGFRRAQAAVLEREAEIVAGYAELEYAGFLSVSAPDPEALALSCAEYEQAAARAGLLLHALDASQDLGLLCTLPVGRGLADGGS